WRIGKCTAVGSPEAVFMRHLAVQLVADKYSVADDVELGRLHALFVVANRAEAVFDLAVAGDVQQVAAVFERAELVKGGEARPGVGSFVAESAVEFGGMTDRFVDRQP